MTNTDTLEAHDADEFRESIRLAEPQPSADYDDARTPSEINVRYREIWAAKVEVYGDHFSVPKDEVRVMQEDMRRAHVRATGRAPKRRRTQAERDAAATPIVTQPTETPEGLVITCLGPCGETKSFKKFPTLGGGRPGREAVCRSCRDARIAATKKGS